MLKRIKDFLKIKYLQSLTEENNTSVSDIEYLKKLLEVLDPKIFSTIIINLNSPKTTLKSIHSNFEELIKFLIIINNTIEKSSLLYRDSIFIEEKEHEIINFLINSKGQALDFGKCILSLKQLLETFYTLYKNIQNSEKENDKINIHYLKSYIKHLCGILNDLIKLQ